MLGSTAARPSKIAQHKAGAQARAQRAQEQRRRAEEKALAAAVEEAPKEALPETTAPVAPKRRNKALLVLAALGPGIVTAMAGNDARRHFHLFDRGR